MRNESNDTDTGTWISCFNVQRLSLFPNLFVLPISLFSLSYLPIRICFLDHCSPFLHFKILGGSQFSSSSILEPR